MLPIAALVLASAMAADTALYSGFGYHAGYVRAAEWNAAWADADLPTRHLAQGYGASLGLRVGALVGDVTWTARSLRTSRDDVRQAVRYNTLAPGAALALADGGSMWAIGGSWDLGRVTWREKSGEDDAWTVRERLPLRATTWFMQLVLAGDEPWQGLLVRGFAQVHLRDVDLDGAVARPTTIGLYVAVGGAASLSRP